MIHLFFISLHNQIGNFDMRIGIEAQRIFRKNKHGMDYVVLQEIKEIQKMDNENEYFVFVAPGEDRCLDNTNNVHVIVIGGGLSFLGTIYTTEGCSQTPSRYATLY